MAGINLRLEGVPRGLVGPSLDLEECFCQVHFGGSEENVQVLCLFEGP